MTHMLNGQVKTGESGRPRIAIVGAGISGLAAAQECAAVGARLDIFEMGENPGGRLAVRDLPGPLWLGHVVDVGAAFFTVSDSDFEPVVREWQSRGLAHPWSSECAVVTPSGTHTSQGRIRWATAQGLRSLVRDGITRLSEDGRCGVTFEHRVQSVVVTSDGVQLDDNLYDAVVLACPDPQAQRIVDATSAPELWEKLALARWNPIISHTMVFAARTWDAHGLWFVEQSGVLATIADDGSRRGDAAAVLVAHSTPELAKEFLDKPDDAVPQMWAEVCRALNISTPPEFTITKRWGLAHPVTPHQEPFGADSSGRLFVCGDGWGGKPRIEGAWLSGRRAARAALTTLGC